MIFQRFSFKIITSDAIKLSSDFALIATPTLASYKLNTSFNPSPIIITCSFLESYISFSFYYF